jgi:transcriptional regulator with XRE-family HTH domain
MAAKLSQEKLAELAGVHRNYVGDVERAEENVSLLKILQFCRSLGIPLSRLVADMEKIQEEQGR